MTNQNRMKINLKAIIFSIFYFLWPYAKWLLTISILISSVVFIHILIVSRQANLQKADVVVVLGAKVNANGTLSDALYDRTRTACDLYHQGWAKHILFSGGWDNKAPYSEPQAMRYFALQHGIPDSAICLDEHGINTQATIQTTKKLAKQHGWKTILVVSHDYHLARIQLCCSQQKLSVFTIPAQESYFLTAKPYFIAREVAAWLYYWAFADPIETCN